MSSNSNWDSDLSSRLAKMELELRRDAQGAGVEVDLDILECPVCFETCLPPSYSCKNGHLVCGKCRDKGIFQCPTCRDETLTHAKELDDFTKRFKFQCNNHALGCTETLTSYVARKHENTCRFRPIQCPTEGCGIKVAFCKGLKQHLLNCHEEFVGVKQQKIMKDSLPKTDYIWPVHYILFGDTAVAVHLEIKSQVVRAWGNIPGRSEVNDLSLSLTFQGSNANQMTLTWAGLVLGDDNMNTGLEFKASIDTLLKYVQNGTLSVIANISSRQNPASASASESGNMKESIPKCSHYSRRCSLVCPDTRCNGIFGCRICHDEVKTDHKLHRRAVRFVFCHKCSSIQPAERSCGCCGNVFARYYCSVCHLYDEKDPRLVFHCEKCGMCRVKTDVSLQYRHCDSCGICWSEPVFRTHNCQANAARQDCVVCHKDLLGSREPITTASCTHYFHTSCFEKLMSEMRGCCPVCIRS